MQGFASRGGVNDRLFQAFARIFPTQHIGGNALGLLWRLAFYAMRPSQPFIMATRHYRLWAMPKKGTLTRAVIRRGCWEATLTRLFLPHLRIGGFMVDAGANFGHFSLVAAGIVGRSGKVIAFEPHRPSYQLLRANADLNGFTWLTTVRAALGETEGSAVLTADAANAGGHSLDVGNVGSPNGNERVPLCTLGAYLAANAPGRRLDVLKIDVQGFEGHVIEGAMATLQRDRPVVLCEITPAMVLRAGRDVAEILAPFVALGYDAQMVWDSEARVESASFEAIQDYCKAADGHIDLVLTPRELTRGDCAGAAQLKAVAA